MESSKPDSPSLRVAIEGCGHGCLHDIYASVERAAALKGWDGVDLLIIGGDFQAVRNSNDMACMSVPQKFKAIGDFHEYYSGARTAPYLTIFVGGNHEASNYLFELYHGGWVAPNIYYLGAANVIRCGPLRIAGMSGIWKGYDFRKPHFERLPYNSDDISSIYHIRELDVRKLLQIRTQVDVGLSHDWPKQVEYGGDHETLFRVKRGFGEDSRHGKLGNPAARYVLDRLRPAYWFSAHLHTKFAASIEHGDYVIPGTKHANKQTAPQEAPKPPYAFGLDGAAVTSLVFGEDEQKNDESQTAQAPSTSEVTDHSPESHAKPSESATHNQSKKRSASQTGSHGPDEAPSGLAPHSDSTHPGDTQNRLSAWQNFHVAASKKEADDSTRELEEHAKLIQEEGTTSKVKHNLTWRKIDVDEDDGRTVAGVERPRSDSSDSKKRKTTHEAQEVKNSDEISLDLSSDSEKGSPAPTSYGTASSRPAVSLGDVKGTTDGTSSEPEHRKPTGGADVPEDLRSQLPASFARPQPEADAPVHLPLPEDIFNKNTQFLALDKCLPNRDFLQLLEIPAVSVSDGAPCERPYRLQYDKEWLAITRVFAKDLQLGNPSAKPPLDKGDAVYKPQIMEAEDWLEEHVVKPGKLNVPENFTPTAPFYDPNVPVTTTQIPPEYNNPQTAQFCDLIGIENKFHLTDEERQQRINAGPRPSEPRMGGSGRFNRRGNPSFGRSRGRGRGRGRY